MLTIGSVGDFELSRHLSESLIREFLGRKGLKKTLEMFDNESVSTQMNLYNFQFPAKKWKKSEKSKRNCKIAKNWKIDS